MAKSANPLLPLLSDLDRLLLREFQCWPWESENPEVHAVWERLTHPDNLAALADWAQGVESFNEYAKGITLRALAECRSRAVPLSPIKRAEPGAATDLGHGLR
jgi:hypothetical protein